MLYGALPHSEQRKGETSQWLRKLLSFTSRSDSHEGAQSISADCEVERIIAILSVDDTLGSTYASASSSDSFDSLHSNVSGSRAGLTSVGISSRKDSAKKSLIGRVMMQQLHYLIPSTATAFHLLSPGYPIKHHLSANNDSCISALTRNKCAPLLPEAVLVDVEPSPQGSRSRSHSVDPGTRVEQIIASPAPSSVDNLYGLDQSTKNSAHCNTIRYRRIGDSRLTFLNCSAADFLLLNQSKPLQHLSPSKPSKARRSLQHILLERVSKLLILNKFISYILYFVTIFMKNLYL